MILGSRCLRPLCLFRELLRRKQRVNAVNMGERLHFSRIRVRGSTMGGASDGHRGRRIYRPLLILYQLLTFSRHCPFLGHQEFLPLLRQVEVPVPCSEVMGNPLLLVYNRLACQLFRRRCRRAAFVAIRGRLHFCCRRHRAYQQACHLLCSLVYHSLTLNL